MGVTDGRRRLRSVPASVESLPLEDEELDGSGWNPFSTRKDCFYKCMLTEPEPKGRAVKLSTSLERRSYSIFADHQLMESKGSHWLGKRCSRQDVFPMRQSAHNTHTYLLEPSGSECRV